MSSALQLAASNQRIASLQAALAAQAAQAARRKLRAESGNYESDTSSDDDEEEEEEEEEEAASASLPEVEFAGPRGKNPARMDMYRSPASEDDEAEGEEEEEEEDDEPAAAAAGALHLSAAVAMKKKKEEDEEEEEELATAVKINKKKPTAAAAAASAAASADAAAAAAAPAADKKVVIPINIRRAEVHDLVHPNPLIGEEFVRGAQTFRVVSTPSGVGEDGYIPCDKAPKKTTMQPVWTQGSFDRHCFNAVDVDCAATVETFVQTSALYFHTVSKRGAEEMFKVMLEDKKRRDYRSDALAAGNRIPTACEGVANPRGAVTWMPWVLFNGLTQPRKADAAAADTKKTAGTKRKAGGTAATATAVAAWTDAPELLVRMCREYVADNLEPYVRTIAQTKKNNLVVQLDATVALYASLWAAETTEAMDADMARRHKLQCIDAPAATRRTPAAFATVLQLQMFMMTHPTGRAILQELRDRLAAEVLEVASVDMDNEATFA